MLTSAHRIVTIAVIAASATLLAACSGSGSEPGDASGSGSGANASSTIANDAAGGDDTTPVTPAVRNTRSIGCDTGATPATAVDEERTVDTAGTTRTYLRHVPPAHDGGTALPVIVDLHGYSEGARIHTLMSNLGPYGDEQGFITVTPQGEGEVPRWIAEVGSTDVAFIGNVLDDVESSLCVDLDRVYVAGLSNGAFLTSTLACVLADRFAAAAPVAGIQDIEGCDPSRPVPVIAFHGTADTYVAYEGGFGSSVADLPAPDGSGRTLGELAAAGEEGLSGADAAGPPVADIAAAWAARNGCEPTPTETPVSDDTTKIAFACPSGADVELYRVTDGGHAWPGSEFSASLAQVVGTTTMSIDANELMWAFFQAHPLVLS